MPTYQYACTECAERLEVVQRFSDDPLTDCPVCAGRLRKVFSAVGVVFKGSGFYRTDSRAAVAASNGKGEGKSEGAGKRDGAGEGGGDRDGAGEGAGKRDGAKPAKGSGASGEATGNGSKSPGGKPATGKDGRSATSSGKSSTGTSKTAGSAA